MLLVPGPGAENPRFRGRVSIGGSFSEKLRCRQQSQGQRWAGAAGCVRLALRACRCAASAPGVAGSWTLRAEAACGRLAAGVAGDGRGPRPEPWGSPTFTGGGTEGPAKEESRSSVLSSETPVSKWKDWYREVRLRGTSSESSGQEKQPLDRPAGRSLAVSAGARKQKSPER